MLSARPSALMSKNDLFCYILSTVKHKQHSGRVEWAHNGTAEGFPAQCTSSNPPSPFIYPPE